MARVCTVCTHPDREAIDAAVVTDAASIRRIAAQHGLAESSLRRHRDTHLSAAIQAVRAERAEVVVSLYDELLDLIGRVRSVVDRAERRNQPDAMLKAVAELRRLLEVLGKVTGELRDGPQVAINLLSNPEWLAVQAAIVDALEPFPEARLAVAQRLAALPAEASR